VRIPEDGIRPVRKEVKSAKLLHGSNSRERLRAHIREKKFHDKHD